MLVELAGPGGLGALLPEDPELLWRGCECDEEGTAWDYGGPRGGSLGGLPLLSTARHSSSVFWTGYDIVLESAALELKRLPIRGMGIDLSWAAR